MSWLWGKKPEENQITPHQAQRQKQIDSLKQQHRKLIEVSKDSSYRLPFSVGAQTFFLDVALTSTFPRDPPVLRLTPRGTHQWVDANGSIVCPKLLAFSMHSDLGRLVGEIIDEFQRNPPLMPRDIPPSEMAGGAFYPPNHFPSFPQPPVPNVPRRSDSPSFPAFQPPTRTSFTESMWQSVSDNFPELKSMSITELQAILDSKDEKYVLDQVCATPVIASLRDEAKRIMESNNKLAASNISRRPFLEEKKSELFDKYTLAGEQRQKFDVLQQKQEALLRNYDPSMLQEQIRIAAAEAEMESEAVAEDFLSGKVDLETFLPTFLEKRKIAHTRRALEDAFGKQQLSGGFRF